MTKPPYESKEGTGEVNDLTPRLPIRRLILLIRDECRSEDNIRNDKAKTQKDDCTNITKEFSSKMILILLRCLVPC